MQIGRELLPVAVRHLHPMDPRHDAAELRPARALDVWDLILTLHEKAVSIGRQWFQDERAAGHVVPGARDVAEGRLLAPKQ